MKKEWKNSIAPSELKCLHQLNLNRHKPTMTTISPVGELY